jgi:hypothetical protein
VRVTPRVARVLGQFQKFDLELKEKKNFKLVPETSSPFKFPEISSTFPKSRQIQLDYKNFNIFLTAQSNVTEKIFYSENIFLFTRFFRKSLPIFFFFLSSSTMKALIPLMEYEQSKNNLVDSRKGVYHLREGNNVKNKL